MANLETVADYASALRDEQDARGKLVVEVAALRRELKRAPAAEKRRDEAEARVAGLEVERDEARRQLDAAKVEIRNLSTQLHGQQNELEELRKFKAAVNLVAA